MIFVRDILVLLTSRYWNAFRLSTTLCQAIELMHQIEKHENSFLIRYKQLVQPHRPKNLFGFFNRK